MTNKYLRFADCRGCAGQWLAILMFTMAALALAACATPDTGSTCPGHAQVFERHLAGPLRQHRVAAEPEAFFMVKAGKVDNVQVRYAPKVYRDAVEAAVNDLKCPVGGASGTAMHLKLRFAPGLGDLPGAVSVVELRPVPGPPSPPPPEALNSCPGFAVILRNELDGEFDRHGAVGEVAVQLRVNGRDIVSVRMVGGPEVYYPAIDRAVKRFNCYFEDNGIKYVNFKVKFEPPSSATPTGAPPAR